MNSILTQFIDNMRAATQTKYIAEKQNNKKKLFNQCISDKAVHLEDSYNHYHNNIQYVIKSLKDFNWAGYIKFPSDFIDKNKPYNEIKKIYGDRIDYYDNVNGIIGVATNIKCMDSYFYLRDNFNDRDLSNCKFNTYEIVFAKTKQVAMQVYNRYSKQKQYNAILSKLSEKLNDSIYKRNNHDSAVLRVKMFFEKINSSQNNTNTNQYFSKYCNNSQPAKNVKNKFDNNPKFQNMNALNNPSMYAKKYIVKLHKLYPGLYASEYMKLFSLYWKIFRQSHSGLNQAEYINFISKELENFNDLNPVLCIKLGKIIKNSAVEKDQDSSSDESTSDTSEYVLNDDSDDNVDFISEKTENDSANANNKPEDSSKNQVMPNIFEMFTKKMDNYIEKEQDSTDSESVSKSESDSDDDDNSISNDDDDKINRNKAFEEYIKQINFADTNDSENENKCVNNISEEPVNYNLCKNLEYDSENDTLNEDRCVINISEEPVNNNSCKNEEYDTNNYISKPDHYSQDDKPVQLKIENLDYDNILALETLFPGVMDKIANIKAMDNCVCEKCQIN